MSLNYMYHSIGSVLLSVCKQELFFSLLNSHEYVKHEITILIADINIHLLEENAITNEYINILQYILYYIIYCNK